MIAKRLRTGCVCLLLTLPALVQAQFDYITNNGTITITGYIGPGGAVTIPGAINGLAVTRIGDDAFNQVTGLTSITIPSSIISIGRSAFLRCPDLSSLSIPNSVVTVGTAAFRSCESLTNVTVGNSVTNLGYHPFIGCRNLTTITVDGLNSFYSSQEGVLFNKSQTTLLQFPEGKTGSYTIPNGVTDIGDETFYGCGGLTNVTIPTGVKSIGWSAFAFCLKLTSVTIPSSVTSIGDYALWYCISLPNVTIPESVTDIGIFVLAYCYDLTAVYFKGNAPAREYNALYYDDLVTAFYLPGTTGWGPTFGGRPTARWQPKVQTADSRFGVGTNGFGFTITWASGMTVVVEANTKLGNSNWVPVGTNAITGGSSYFSDPEWTNFPGRFYRLRWP